ncbi:hypothetical protein TGPRC2_424320 [Toxoplasma gondii TgCatPRC2]|uniref:Uncharacterized protein n=1 Tax=Toxoplasma gondii TgCatPRC2 TaxID=1130821 RepID=A0A151HI04_TOXGO|nr:hypothetical protein TGPRC2_424320 [Toxoplasma gondii TgCatPRC2]
MTRKAAVMRASGGRLERSACSSLRRDTPASAVLKEEGRRLVLVPLFPPRQKGERILPTRAAFHGEQPKERARERLKVRMRAPLRQVGARTTPGLLGCTYAATCIAAQRLVSATRAGKRSLPSPRARSAQLVLHPFQMVSQGEGTSAGGVGSTHSEHVCLLVRLSSERQVSFLAPLLASRPREVLRHRLSN